MAGLSKALFTNLAKVAFTVAGEAVKAGIYHQDGAQAYNASTRKLANNTEYDSETGLIIDDNANLPIDCILEAYKDSQFDGEIIRTGDVKFLIIQDELPITPEINEHLEVEGVNYRIVNITPDPIAATWVLQCRV